MNETHAFPTARLLVFAKAPVPGQVKTRLAGQLGARGAALLYGNLWRGIFFCPVGARLFQVELWCAPDTRHGFFVVCRHQYGVRLRPQGAGDLGQRMNRALNRTLADGHPAVLIGGDCASLGVEELRAAFLCLIAGRAAVLGPAADGGYVLVGLSQPCPEIFQGIAWGAGTVLQETRRRFEQAGVDWTELPLGWDVDTPTDLRRLRRSVPGMGGQR